MSALISVSEGTSVGGSAAARFITPASASDGENAPTAARAAAVSEPSLRKSRLVFTWGRVGERESGALAVRRALQLQYGSVRQGRNPYGRRTTEVSGVGRAFRG